MTFGQIVVFFLCVAAGFIWAVFAFINPLISLRVGLPISKISQKMYPDIDFSAMKKIYVFNIILYLILDAIVIAVLFLFVQNDYRMAVLIGMALALLMGFKQTGKNKANVSEVMEKAYRIVPEEKQEEYTANVVTEFLAFH